MAASLGVLALLVQSLVFAFHRPAQAATVLPFQDPAAWCLAIGTGNPVAPDQDKAPDQHKSAMVCPICQTLQAAGAAMLAADVVLVAPVASSPAILLPRSAAPPSAPDRTTSSPRAPPALI
jgi:hypothetical protein